MNSNIVKIRQFDLEYPAILKNIDSPPKQLYRLGANLYELGQKYGDNFIAIVGTRMPSKYGAMMAAKIAEQIEVCGGIVVSGLAYGIDAVAHFAAVKAKMPTIAVLACGVDQVYPRAHLKLADEILKNGGTILSEYPSGTESYKGNFVLRNRIISGLCRATIVIEAKEKSGALITARLALDQGREVYALVGDVTRPQACGPLNLLIKGEAEAIYSVEDLMRQLGFNPLQKKLESMSMEEKIVFEILKKESMENEKLLNESGLHENELQLALTRMEISGILGRNQYGEWQLN